MKIERIMEKVKNESNRRDKVFTGVEFNVRGDQVVMNYIYDEFSSRTSEQSGHYMPHGEDPAFIGEEEMKMLIEKLQDKNIHFVIRKDDFI